jgi:hypothetical protein
MQPYNKYVDRARFLKQVDTTGLDMSIFCPWGDECHSWVGCTAHKLAYLVTPESLRKGHNGCPECNPVADGPATCTFYESWYAKMYESGLKYRLGAQDLYVLPQEMTTVEELDIQVTALTAPIQRRLPASAYDPAIEEFINNDKAYDDRRGSYCANAAKRLNSKLVPCTFQRRPRSDSDCSYDSLEDESFEDSSYEDSAESTNAAVINLAQKFMKAGNTKVRSQARVA